MHTIKVKTKGTHSGADIHHHEQVITPVSFSATKIRKRTTANTTP